MAQGAIKKKAKTTPTSSKRKSILAPKPGAKVIAPKKKNLVDAKKMTKKLSAGLTAQTERTLAERAGHLEMLGGGKNSKKGGGKVGKGGGKDKKGDGKVDKTGDGKGKKS